MILFGEITVESFNNVARVVLGILRGPMDTLAKKAHGE